MIQKHVQLRDETTAFGLSQVGAVGHDTSDFDLQQDQVEVQQTEKTCPCWL